MRAPVCIYCASPNPRPLTEAEWGDLIDWARNHPVGALVRGWCHHDGWHLCDPDITRTYGSRRDVAEPQGTLDDAARMGAGRG